MRKCICQQPGQFGCHTHHAHMRHLSEKQRYFKLSGSNMPTEDNIYLEKRNLFLFKNTKKANITTHAWMQSRHEAKPIDGGDAFRKVVF